ncbi:hypothetical protein [Eubacterium aggregans]|uniref:hypothetical protein n=2 Tax=Eubacterium aggregans TaxID=81409 RepID=UPI003F2CAAB8
MIKIIKQWTEGVAVLLVMSYLLLSALIINSIVYAEEPVVELASPVKSEVIYNNDYSQATISFDMRSVDWGKYEIQSILSNIEGKVVYNRDTECSEVKGSDSRLRNIENGVLNNGQYSFTISYFEGEKSVEKNLQLQAEQTIDITEINKEDYEALSKESNFIKDDWNEEEFKSRFIACATSIEGTDGADGSFIK